MQLVIANKAYSSWSFRPWIALKQLGIPFEEILIPLYQPETAESIRAHSPAGRVPILKDGSITVWESLAILDYVDRFYAKGRIWPEEMAAHGMARAVSAEMHSGFTALRAARPMNIRRSPKPAAVTSSEVAADIARIESIWTDARQNFGQGGPFLFGKFSGADAMFAPVVSRFHVYQIPVNATCQAYMAAMMESGAWKEWHEAGIREPWVYDHYNVL